MSAEKTINTALADFIHSSPSPFHAVKTLTDQLDAEGYTKLTESRAWKLEPGGKYYVTRNETTLATFRIPTSEPQGFMISAAHSDAPTYKIKENAEIVTSDCYVRLATEGYGGMIHSTWLDRPLSVAGRVVVRTENGIESRLVNIDRDLLLIPNVAIHMNRGLNSGYTYNVNVDMVPLFGGGDAKDKFKAIVAEAAGVSTEDLLSCDLSLYLREAASTWGAQGEFLSAPRLDDLQCAFGTFRGFLAAKSSQSIPLCVVFDNEEVGSSTKQGAASGFLSDTLVRICECLGMSGGKYRQLLANSMMVSADNAHAVHPNHPEYADANHRPQMNKGIVIKYNASQRYTTDAISSALFSDLCKKCNVPTQAFFNRSDMAGGSTLGSISNTRVAVSTVDIGLPQLAMHSAYETAGTADTAYLITAMKEFFSASLQQKEDGQWEIQAEKPSKRLMIASDFDGTICYKGKVSEEDKEAIRRFRAAGNLFGLVTGRLTQTALAAASTVEHDFTIACSGGAIYDKDGKPEYAKSIEGDGMLTELFLAAKRCGSVNFFVDTDQKTYSFDIKGEPDQICVGDGERIQEVCFYCPDHAGIDRFLAENADCFRSSYAIFINGGSVDMPARGVSKETGIRKYAAMHDIDTDSIFCVGDQTNDLPMVRAFHGFAVGNAVPALKEEAEYQCDRIADMIEKLLSGQF